MEVGVRWAQEAYDFVNHFASAKARDTRNAGLETSIGANDIVTIHNWQKLRAGEGIRGKT